MFLSAALAVLLSTQPNDPPKPFEFKAGDRIVWLGSTLVEREQRYGYWETALLAANADKNITVRNLGWSGDTVHGEARGRFDFNNPDMCFKQLVNLTLELKPTVIFISYGTNEAFEGKEGLPKFEKGLEKLLDALKPAKARIVLLSPMRFYRTKSYPDPIPMNEKLKLYRDSIKAIAEKRDVHFADLYHVWPSFHIVSENGMHLTEDGYKHTAVPFTGILGQKYTRFPETKLESLRQAVIAKNELFFHRWRPQNETYLFGFRKHEQGKNAKEVAEFDPLVAKAEDEIAKLRKELK
ncbi:MAG: SGNH/GDSL hydrolase family protein [Planctomycetia bacterium]|nr:SGNH/GDSL hydrolase family protein [Planctomycetia bacterium]